MNPPTPHISPVPYDTPPFPLPVSTLPVPSTVTEPPHKPWAAPNAGGGTMCPCQGGQGQPPALQPHFQSWRGSEGPQIPCAPHVQGSGCCENGVKASQKGQDAIITHVTLKLSQVTLKNTQSYSITQMKYKDLKKLKENPDFFSPSCSPSCTEAGEMGDPLS